MVPASSGIPKIGVGVDPEFFVIDTEMQRYCSAHELVPGTKEEPHPLKHGAVQVDGVAIEYNTEPAYTALEFVQNNTEVIKQIREMVPKRYEFIFEPQIKFDKYYFDKHIPDGPKELGCMPDYNAWSKTMNPRPSPPASAATMRTASGHIHVSWTSGASVDDPSHRYDCELVVRALESTLFPWVKYWDKDKERASLYGKPGAFRYKPYGIEWRTPSNAWLNHPEIWEWLFEAIQWTMTKLFANELNILDRHIYSLPLVISNGSASRTSIELYMTKNHPGFPMMPLLKGEDKPAVEVKKAIKKKRAKKDSDFIYKRISPTSSTINYDINLDIPATSSIPLPDYLAAEADKVHPNKGYGELDDYDYDDDF